MNKRITQKNIILKHIILANCLLFTSSQTLADRPAMSERSEILEPEMIEIDTNTPVFIEEPALDARPAVEDMSAVEVEAETQPEPVVEIEAEAELEPLVENTEPDTQVYDQQTEIIGDVIELQAGDTLPVNIIDFPRRGMTMDKVKNELGQPREASDAIGKPPITTWTYNDRVVYFEYSSVVHVVATH